MDKKLRLDAIRAKYQVIRDKLLLFSAGFGGSFMLLSTKQLDFLFSLLTGLGLVVSLIGLLINLSAAGKLLRQIEELENE